MTTLTIYKRLSIIHCIKCDKAISSDEAENSRISMEEILKSQTIDISTKIENYMNENPTVTEKEIIDLFKSQDKSKK